MSKTLNLNDTEVKVLTTILDCLEDDFSIGLTSNKIARASISTIKDKLKPKSMDGGLQDVLGPREL